MFCENCGQEINDNADICIHCGKSVSSKSSNALDNPSHLPGVIGCCFPIVGLILYFLWKDQKPKSASLIIKWTLAGIGLSIIGVVVYIALILMVGIGLSSY